VRIAVFDAGFKEMDTHPAFTHLFSQGKILQQRDFYGGKEDVYYHCYHGTSVVSAIAGKWKGRNLGAAPEAEFLLARTEHLFSEKLVEEDHWFAAMEWADQQGADIISSSLGYGWKRYEFSTLDGLTSRVTNAARIAVRKGIFVVNSIGNDGSGKHPWLSAPADADSVCAVGGSYPMMRYAIPFTSVGPNARGVLKPDVAAPAYVLTAVRKGEFGTNAGTSFACPLVAGMVACMMQLYPQKSNMDLLVMLRGIGHFVPYYDGRLGNGVPDAHLLFEPRKVVPPTFEPGWNGDTLLLNFPPALVDSMDEAKANGKPLCLHVQALDGHLMNQYELRVKKGEYLVKLPMKNPKGSILRVWFEGYLWERKEE
jgi:subtilisin family serine protease